MKFHSLITDKLDYSKSEFQVIERNPTKESLLDIESPRKATAAIKLHREECARSIFKFLVPKFGCIFKRRFDHTKYDAFRIGHFGESFYFSQRLLDALITENVTGFEAIEQPLLSAQES